MSVRTIASTIQVRSETTGIRTHKTLQDAMSDAMEDRTVWKMSFEVEDGTRIRLVRENNQWVYENINGDRNQ